MTASYWDESYPPEIYDPPLPVPTVTIADGVVQAGGPAVDIDTTLDGDPVQDVDAASGRIIITGGAVLIGHLTFTMAWGTGTEAVTWAANGEDAVGSYGPFPIPAGMHGEDADTIQADADAPPGVYPATTQILADNTVLASDNWTLTITEAEPPPEG